MIILDPHVRAVGREIIVDETAFENFTGNCLSIAANASGGLIAPI